VYEPETIKGKEMPTVGPMIAASVRLGLGYAERLLKDVTPEQFPRYAKIGGTVIESNHPAFIYGHLSLYPSRVIEQVGGDPAEFSPSAKFEQLFSKDARCVDDADGSIYPPMDEVTSALLRGYRAAAAALEGASDEVFSDENPNEAMRGTFPTKGAVLGFYVGGHFMLHMGQMSAWRRAMGMGPA
jgi:hypothetical protein